MPTPLTVPVSTLHPAGRLSPHRLPYWDQARRCALTVSALVPLYAADVAAIAEVASWRAAAWPVLELLAVLLCLLSLPLLALMVGLLVLRAATRR